MAILGIVGDAIGRSKDLAVRFAINKLLGDIGSVDDLAVDRAGKRITAKLTLAGEAEPIDVTIDGWEFGDEADPNRVRICGLTTSRAWLNAIAERAVVNRWFAVPPEYIGAMHMAVD